MLFLPGTSHAALPVFTFKIRNGGFTLATSLSLQGHGCVSKRPGLSTGPPDVRVSEHVAGSQRRQIILTTLLVERRLESKISSTLNPRFTQNSACSSGNAAQVVVPAVCPATVPQAHASMCRSSCESFLCFSGCTGSRARTWLLPR